MTSTNYSSAGEIAYMPAVKITNTVFLGDDAGNSCPKGVKYVENYFVSAAT